MLAIMGGALAVLYALAPPAGRPSGIERLRLVLPGLLGAISLVPVLRGGTDHVSVALYHGLRLRNFLRFPPLSALSPPGRAVRGAGKGHQLVSVSSVLDGVDRSCTRRRSEHRQMDRRGRATSRTGSTHASGEIRK